MVLECPVFSPLLLVLKAWLSDTGIWSAARVSIDGYAYWPGGSSSRDTGLHTGGRLLCETLSLLVKVDPLCIIHHLHFPCHAAVHFYRKCALQVSWNGLVFLSGCDDCDAIHRCSTPSSYEVCSMANATIIGLDVLQELSVTKPLYINFVALFTFGIGFRILGYLALRFLHRKPLSTWCWCIDVFLRLAVCFFFFFFFLLRMKGFRTQKITNN